MAYTNLAGLMSDLMDLTVTDVATVLDQPPEFINDTDLPLMWPNLPEQSGELVSVGGAVGLAVGRAEVIIAIEPEAFESHAVNFALAVSIVDDLYAQFSANTVAIGIDSWTIAVERRVINEAAYWCVVATVEAS